MQSARGFTSRRYCRGLALLHLAALLETGTGLYRLAGSRSAGVLISKREDEPYGDGTCTSRPATIRPNIELEFKRGGKRSGKIENVEAMADLVLYRAWQSICYDT